MTNDNQAVKTIVFFIAFFAALTLALSAAVEAANPLEGLEYYPPASSTGQSNVGQRSPQALRVVGSVSFDSVNRRQTASIPCIGEGQGKQFLFKTNAPSECVSLETRGARCANGEAEVSFEYDAFCEPCGRFYYDFSFPGEDGTFRVETNIDCKVGLLYVTSTKLRQTKNFKETLLRHVNVLAAEGVKTKFLVLDKDSVAEAYGAKKFDDFEESTSEWKKYKMILDKVAGVTNPEYALILGGVDVFPMAVSERPVTIKKLNKETCETEERKGVNSRPSDEFYSKPLGSEEGYRFVVARMPSVPGDSTSKSAETMLESAIKRHEKRSESEKMLITTPKEWLRENGESMVQAVVPGFSCDSDIDCYFVTEYCEWGNERLKKTTKVDGACGKKEYTVEEKDKKNIECKQEELASVLEDSDLIVIAVHGSPGQLCGFDSEKYPEDPGYTKTKGAAIEGTFFTKNEVDLRGNNPLVVSMACYSGAIEQKVEGGLIPNKFIDAGASAFVGSTQSGLQDYTPNLIALFLSELKKGKTTGQAFKTVKTTSTAMPLQSLAETRVGGAIFGEPGTPSDAKFHVRTILQYYGDPTLKFDFSQLT